MSRPGGPEDHVASIIGNVGRRTKLDRHLRVIRAVGGSKKKLHLMSLSPGLMTFHLNSTETQYIVSWMAYSIGFFRMHTNWTSSEARRVQKEFVGGGAILATTLLMRSVGRCLPQANSMHLTKFARCSAGCRGKVD